MFKNYPEYLRESSLLYRNIVFYFIHIYLYALGTEGHPCERGSPSPMKVEPRWTPVPGKNIVFGYTSSGFTPLTATSAGSENKITPKNNSFWIKMITICINLNIKIIYYHILSMNTYSTLVLAVMNLIATIYFAVSSYANFAFYEIFLSGYFFQLSQVINSIKEIILIRIETYNIHYHTIFKIKLTTSISYIDSYLA